LHFDAEIHHSLQRVSFVDNLLILMPDPDSQSQHSLTIHNSNSSRHGGILKLSLVVLTSFFHLSSPEYQQLVVSLNPFVETI
jgi:hypothetical protein